MGRWSPCAGACLASTNSDLYEWQIHVAHVRDEMIARLRRLEAPRNPGR